VAWKTDNCVDAGVDSSTDAGSDSATGEDGPDTSIDSDTSLDAFVDSSFDDGTSDTPTDADTSFGDTSADADGTDAVGEASDAVADTLADTSGPADSGCGDASSTSCGCGPGARYTVVTPPSVGTLSCPWTDADGSGLVKDNLTGLIWSARSRIEPTISNYAFAVTYCAGKGARLPTKDEAFAIADTRGSRCAFPCPWGAWTSTDDPSRPDDPVGYVFYVSSGGSSAPSPPYGKLKSDNAHILCVR
jgi:hypothetical protein